MVTHTYTHTYTHTHTHTHTHTYTHDNYYNPRCAHAHRGLIIILKVHDQIVLCYTSSIKNGPYHIHRLQLFQRAFRDHSHTHRKLVVTPTCHAHNVSHTQKCKFTNKCNDYSYLWFKDSTVAFLHLEISSGLKGVS